MTRSASCPEPRKLPLASGPPTETRLSFGSREVSSSARPAYSGYRPVGDWSIANRAGSRSCCILCMISSSTVATQLCCRIYQKNFKACPQPDTNYNQSPAIKVTLLPALPVYRFWVLSSSPLPCRVLKQAAPFGQCIRQAQPRLRKVQRTRRN